MCSKSWYHAHCRKCSEDPGCLHRLNVRGLACMRYAVIWDAQVGMSLH